MVDEVDGEHHAALHAPLRLDAAMTSAPVFARQGSERGWENTQPTPSTLGPSGAGCGARTCLWALSWPFVSGWDGLGCLREKGLSLREGALDLF